MNNNKLSLGGRQSNIELLKIILVFGVIILHYGSGEDIQLKDLPEINVYILSALKSVFTCSVDTFILISGYFMSGREYVSYKKPVRLLVQMAIFGEIGYQLQCIISGTEFSIRHSLGHLIPVNYYVTLYCCTYLLAPFLNVLVNNLEKDRLIKSLMLIFAILSIYPTLVDILQEITGNDYNRWGLNSISAYGDDRGYTLINFILMYLIGAGLKKIELQVRLWKLLAVVVGCWILIFIGKYIKPFEYVASSYCNPIVIIASVCLFLIFVQLRIRQNKLINSLAGAVFTTFITHTSVLQLIKEQEFMQSSVLVLLANIVMVCVGIYAGCYCLYLVYSVIEGAFIKVLSGFNKINR